MMNKLPYQVGDIFAVPLDNGKGFCLGVVTGMPRDGKVLMGYFYSDVYSTVPRGDGIFRPEPRDAAGIWIFGDLYLSERRWPIVGQVDNFHPNDWPSPKFLQETMRQLAACSSDGTLEPDGNEAEQYQGDNVMDAGFVEGILAQIATT